MLTSWLLYLETFFINKIEKSRTILGQHRQQSHRSTALTETSLATSESSYPASIIQLHAIVKNSKPTSCAFDPIPSSLLLECLDDILPSFHHTINSWSICD